MMGTRVAALAGVWLLLSSAAIAQAATGIVLGDGQGLAFAKDAGLASFAHISLHIRGPEAVKQIGPAPAGATAFVALGTNADPAAAFALAAAAATIGDATAVDEPKVHVLGVKREHDHGADELSFRIRRMMWTIDHRAGATRRAHDTELPHLFPEIVANLPASEVKS
ncbi:MAG TPA: hypothetical protein VFF60_09090 [Candidatus Binatus sp.]|nr:hypothetical protein [Candidatus Binatus sp.]